MVVYFHRFKSIVCLYIYTVLLLIVIYSVRSGFPNGTNDIPISFKVLPMVPLATNGTIGKITNGTIGRTPNGAIVCVSFVIGEVLLWQLGPKVVITFSCLTQLSMNFSTAHKY